MRANKFATVNLRDILDLNDGTTKAEKIVSSFSCKYNSDVDDFLKSKAIEFARQSISYLLNFYGENGFVKFGERVFKRDEEKGHYTKRLTRLLKYLHN